MTEYMSPAKALKVGLPKLMDRLHGLQAENARLREALESAPIAHPNVELLNQDFVHEWGYEYFQWFNLTRAQALKAVKP